MFLLLAGFEGKLDQKKAQYPKILGPCSDRTSQQTLKFILEGTEQTEPVG
tara:strand:+ start:462 stop:611 length:150 start_codon:yes stop_codon:yes gene_type:complete